MHILVADDDLPSVKLTAFLLEEAGYRVFKAYEASVRRGVSAYSWFIYRIMSPGMRYLFMNPTQRFRLQAAVLSVLAGDVFKNRPARWTVNAFKAVYYLKNLFAPLESLAAWKRRKQALRVSSPA
jgi:CheY-like chemotaxis protein